MSLYHEAAALLTGPSTHGGSLKSRVFSNKDLKSPPAQVYALALETCKWSAVLKEVVENAELLKHERKLTPILSILLSHDLLLAKGGIALPASHGLRQSIDRHKARLTSEFTKARIRRKCPTIDTLRDLIESDHAGPIQHPRWIRVNTVKSTLDAQLETTFQGWEIVPSITEVMTAGRKRKVICLDGHIPNLLAVPPSAMDFTKTEAYKKGEIILQDKASCFPAYLLDPRPEDGDIIDACSAPGNKTTHLAGILSEREGGFARGGQMMIHAFEKDRNRAKTLQKMIRIAGSDVGTVVHPGEDFLRADPMAEEYARVGGLLLDPSCSGSGIVGRDDVPELWLPESPGSNNRNNKGNAIANSKNGNKKRKRPEGEETSKPPPSIMVDDDGETTVVSSEKDLQQRIEALAAFQLQIILHAFEFPAAKKVTYSTCSVHAGENEEVAVRALRSEVARRRGWRVLKRGEQVRGMREWDVRGELEGSEGDGEVAEGCIRAFRDDGRGTMGFFVVGFVRDGDVDGEKGEDEGPYARDEEGRIVRDGNGIPTLKATGRKAVEIDEDGGEGQRFGSGSDGEGPFVRDAEGKIVRDENGMPTLKSGVVEEDESGDDWSGFDD
ncbi:S-adenosyl-L-methionine-dependent methyltransferase [Apiosordaria backusii]|uniref:S-adenosyl-L-methionine-dependent methyltransferase n=1 Tax=Apiosordaria backusii TaxID=314023 RepID=A0AA40BMF7_9PEZI|nr:S-adenosyl-L-methionine-dependent methyltransferase [Apiosordaria backusii]